MQNNFTTVNTDCSDIFFYFRQWEPSVNNIEYIFAVCAISLIVLNVLQSCINNKTIDFCYK
jgi:hypothetical protein